MKVLIRFIFVFALSIFANTSYAQNVFSQNHEIDSLMRKIRAEINLGLYDDALYNIHLCSRQITNKNLLQKEKDTIQIKNATYLRQIELYDYQKGDYNSSLAIGKEILNIQEKIYGKIHPEYALSLSNLAIYNYKLGNFNEAIIMGKEALNLRERLLGKEHPDYARCLANLASFHSAIGNYGEAIRLATEALNIREKVLGKLHSDYAQSLNNLANYYSKIGNYSDAIRLGKEALKVNEKLFGKYHPDYAIILNSLAFHHYFMGNYKEAIRLATEALSIQNAILPDGHPDCAITMNNLGIFNSRLGNYSEAIRLGTEALKICKHVVGTENSSYATCLNNLAGCYSYFGDYSEAINLATEALNILEKVLGNEHPEYANVLENLANYNSKLGNYSEAIHLTAKALYLYERTLGKEHPNYAKCLDVLASCNSDLGNYNEAIRLATEALNIREKVLGKDHLDYAASLNNLAKYNSSLNNYDEAIRLGKEALNIQEKALGTEKLDNAMSLANLAVYNSNLKNHKEAILMGTRALNIFEKVLGKEHPDYATALSNIAKYNYDSKNYKEAIRLATEALDIRGKVLGREHPYYAISIRNLAIDKKENNQISDFILLWKNYLITNKKIVLANLQGIAEGDKGNYWISNKNEFEELTQHYAFEIQNDTLISYAYNCSLFCKGLLLNTSIETEKIILESNDTTLIAQYNEMKTNMSILNKLYEKPIAERFMNADSLANIIKMQNMEIASKSKTYGDIRKNLEITWQDVQKHLSTNDIAIEMASFPLNEDSTMYIAFTLKKGYECPKLITLFEEKQLKDISQNNQYKDRGVYDLVWEPLADELKGVKNVYFAPTGELYNINIEALPAIVDETDSRNYYRLSSTRQLSYIKDDKKAEGASVYGGLQYNTDIKTIEQNSKQYGVSKTRSWDETLLSADSIRGSMQWQYLPGTLTEAKDVSTTMKNASMPTYLFTDTIGTEASFKALDGKGKKIIHISTHGFYYTDTDSTKMHKAGLDFMHFDNEHQQRYVEDKSLTRSGLLFSGCTTRLMGGKVPEGVDDGILFAKEISNLDLRGLDLVTLSACETGLGDISGEGVFGLQRAFKKAGAQSILMSLWKVDDNATCLLMTRFYGNYLSKHMSKSESLKDAQHYVRTYENGRYNDPKYWAAFIILDAI